MNFREEQQKITDEMKKARRKAHGKFIGYISAAFALVAGLAWNDAVTVRTVIHTLTACAAGAY